MTVHRNRPTGADEAGQMEVRKYETPSDYGICDSSNCSKCDNSFNPFSARVVRIEAIMKGVNI